MLVQDYWYFPGSKFLLMFKILTKGHTLYQGGPDRFVCLLFQGLIHLCIHPASFSYKNLPNKMVLSIYTKLYWPMPNLCCKCLYLQGRTHNTMKVWKHSRHFLQDGNTVLGLRCWTDALEQLFKCQIFRLIQQVSTHPASSINRLTTRRVVENMF